MGPVVSFKEGIWSRTSASERWDHDDKSAGSDLVVNEILGFIHLLAWDDELELINRHALFVLDTFLKHLDCVVFLIVDTEFAIGNGLDFQIELSILEALKGFNEQLLLYLVQGKF